jgi:hypothetical protein
VSPDGDEMSFVPDSTGAVMRKLLLAVVAVSTGVALVPADATSAVRLQFDRVLVEPGRTVYVETVGRPFLGVRDVRLYLVPSAAASKVTSIRDRRLVPAARLRVTARGSASVSFRVPAVGPATYAALIYCARCGTKIMRAQSLPGQLQVFEVLRDCKSAPSGSFDRQVRDRALRVGPLFFHVGDGYSFPADQAPPYRAKFPMQVETRSLVTLFVPGADRQSVSLWYATRETATVTFEPCGIVSWWNGGVVVTEPKCVTLYAKIAGRRNVLTIRLPAGRPCV